jgi:hypothetical protein
MDDERWLALAPREHVVEGGDLIAALGAPTL